ncbi:MAG: DUF421 domain-containing protein [Eubacteriales bacterium]|jgi:uncharacterized membrane protein YcaP (DUF421 family)|nr:DUF421 domain-containing protein [Bacillota bacterium]MBV1728379.1 DUF421 domain-containing protein [Desulforudis sp.]MDQ7788824.1 DUF421 domain-containing protein [Clostridia bacterium]MDZ4043985.1 DUF421 domain-containing protein [Eubacteriales bacterium]MBU4533498.1 DUF421 domain-containing protein [Bacillota bacterium]
MDWLFEVVYRGVGAFVAVVFITRLIGKTQMGMLTVTDFVNGIVIGSLAAAMVVDLRGNIWYYIVGLAIFGGLTIFMEWLTMKNRAVRKLLEDVPTIVIFNGKILEDNMRKNRYHVDDLMMQLRAKNVFDIHDVEFAVAEPNGELSVLLKSQKRPVTCEDLQVPTQYEGMSHTIVSDGEILDRHLDDVGLSRAWLFSELAKRGIKDVKQVMYASLDTQGNLYVDVREDNLPKKTGIGEEP